MDNEFFERGAKKIVEVNASVKPHESVVIVTDIKQIRHAKFVSDAVAETGAEVVTCIIPIRDHDGQDPPKSVCAALMEADVIFAPVSISITHSTAMKVARDNGARAILMTAWTDEIFGSPGLLKTDFPAQVEICRNYGKKLTNGKYVHLTSPKGTNLKFSIEGRKANVLTNIPLPGELAPVPDIEVNIVPIEGSANGIFIADASVPYLGIGVLKEEIICTIENGYIVKIEGGDQAKLLDDDLRSHIHIECFNVAELGVGLNPNAQLTGVMLDDEGVMGTIHIGIGTNYSLGGVIKAPTHYDLLMWEPVIKIDGEVIQNDRELFL